MVYSFCPEILGGIYRISHLDSAGGLFRSGGWGMGSHHNIHYFSILLGSMALMLSITATYAQYPDILGTFSSNDIQNEPIFGTGSLTGPPTLLKSTLV